MPDAETDRLGSLTPGSLKTAIRRRLEGFGSAASRATYKNGLVIFADWLDEHRDITDLEDIDVIDCRRYAQHLRRRVRDGELSAASASEDGAYFTTVRAFLEWCVKDERIGQNPAKPERVKEELPKDEKDPERQFWEQDDRDRLLRYTDKMADEALSAGTTPRVEARESFRNRALAWTLALSGVRGAEILRVPGDDKRHGLSWDDVDTEDGLLVVLGKHRERQPTQLPLDAAERLDRYYRLVQPPSDVWPVFPSYHSPSLSTRLRDAVGDAEADVLVDEFGIVQAMYEAGVAPPSMTTAGGRLVLQGICEDAGIDVDGGYLKPHGARRSLGHQLYTEGRAELAQEVLRHQDIGVTHESYKEERTVETRGEVEDVLGGGPHS